MSGRSRTFRLRQFLRLLTVATLLSVATCVRAQSCDEPCPDQTTTPQDPTTIFPHPDDARWFVAGQVNIINQGHLSFPAKYTGSNSLRPQSEDATSRLLTLYTGLELTDRTEVLFDAESASGRGPSSRSEAG